MKWIEFNGLPGCGKSTLSNCLLQEKKGEFYSYSDIACQEKSWLARNLRWIPYIRFKRLYHFFMLAKVSGAKLNASLLKRLYCVERICCTYRCNQSIEGICIVDQGIIQGVLAIVYLNSLKDSAKLKKHFLAIANELRQEVCFINAYISADVCFSRIRTRQNGRSRLDEIKDDDQLLEALTIQERNFCLLRKYLTDFDSLNLDMELEIIENVDRLRFFLAKMQ